MGAIVLCLLYVAGAGWLVVVALYADLRTVRRDRDHWRATVETMLSEIERLEREAARVLNDAD